jgi:hypothetical protein
VKETWTYCVPDQGETLECSGREVEVLPMFNGDDAADAEQVASDEIADHYWSNCDGWESSWPVTFRLRSPRGNVFDVIVDMEHVPSFTSGDAVAVVERLAKGGDRG